MRKDLRANYFGVSIATLYNHGYRFEIPLLQSRSESNSVANCGCHTPACSKDFNNNNFLAAVYI